MESKNLFSISGQIIDIVSSIQPELFGDRRKMLIVLINELINKDFSAVVQLLYRIDVNEKKVKDFLNQNTGTDSAEILADLIIERQLEKIESRKFFSQRSDIEKDEEKWE